MSAEPAGVADDALLGPGPPLEASEVSGEVSMPPLEAIEQTAAALLPSTQDELESACAQRSEVAAEAVPSGRASGEDVSAPADTGSSTVASRCGAPSSAASAVADTSASCEEQVAGAAGHRSSSSSSSLPTSGEPAAAGPEIAGTSFEVNIKCIDGTTTKLDLASDMSGSALKQLLLERMSVPVERQRLIAKGRVIQDTDLVSQHVTGNGQTIHLVQRPEIAAGSASSSSQSAPQTAEQASPDGQVRFQQGVVGLGAGGEADIGQILGAMLGNVGRRGTVLHATPLVRMSMGGAGAPSPAPIGANAGATTATANGAPSAEGSSPAAPLARRRCMSREGLLLGLLIVFFVLAMPLMAWCVVQLETSYVITLPPWHVWALGFHLLGLLLGLPSVYLAFRSPLRGLSALLSQSGSSPLDQGPQAVITQAIAAMTLQPQQMVISQGQGIPGLAGANIMANVHVHEEGLGMAASDMEHPAGAQQLFSWGSASDEASLGSRSNFRGDMQGSLPWQDLSCLSDHSSRLLGRSGRFNCPLPPAQMPHGEVHAFLGALHGATSQLGVGINDLQGAIEGGGASPDHVRQFSATLEAAAHAFANAAAAIHSQAESASPGSETGDNNPAAAVGAEGLLRRISQAVSADQVNSAAATSPSTAVASHAPDSFFWT